MKQLLYKISGLNYQYLLKPLLFQLNPKIAHEQIVNYGEIMGKYKVMDKIISPFTSSNRKVIQQTYYDIVFKSPIGLAAGYDYEGKLTQTLSMLGFGFQTIGTITNKPYQGNPGQMLGRLTKSESLMVNKGFKNPGASAIIKKLAPLKFPIPFGISIGRTNSREQSVITECVDDIISSFQKFENSNILHSYYELNISCPNLYGDVSFYPLKNLKELLTQVDKLNIKRPLFMKMPIEKSDKEILKMLELISKFKIKGVIFGNLQKNRQDKSLNKDELKMFPIGSFSGKPTFNRSNELISLTYKYFSERFLIIGCGGVFNAADAYEKILRGSSLIQLITGLIFKGPQLVAQINSELESLLKKDGFTHISQAIGKKM